MRFGTAVGVLAALALGCAGDGTGPGAGRLPYRTKVSNVEKDAQQEPRTPSTVYVTDFEMETPPQPSQPQGLLGGRGPVRNVVGALRGDDEDPAARAQRLVTQMSEQLVQDLVEQGLNARRLLPGEPLPREGWLVRGVVTELDEGNRLRKAVIGFGAGKSELELYVGILDLARDRDQPFYSFDTANNSGNMPGGAAMKMNPYAMAAKFVISRHADEREVTNTAETIAQQVAGRLKAAAPAAAGG